MSVPKIDIEAFDPGIRRTVLWLRGLRFDVNEATSGGDEESTMAEVEIATTPAKLVSDADKLARALRYVGATVVSVGAYKGGKEAFITAAYEPADSSAVLALSNFDDKSLPAPGADLAAVTNEALADTKSLRDLNDLAREPEARSSR